MKTSLDRSLGNTMNPYLALLLLFGICLLQFTVMPKAGIDEVAPMLPLLAVVSWSLLRGPIAGAWWALVLGILLDFMSIELLGTYLAPMLLVAAIAGLGSRRLFTQRLWLPIMVTTLGTLGFLALHLGIIRLTGGYVDWNLDALLRLTLRPLLLNLLWLPLIYFPLRHLSNRYGEASIGWER